jgi:hypothetical protein
MRSSAGCQSAWFLASLLGWSASAFATAGPEWLDLTPRLAMAAAKKKAHAPTPATPAPATPAAAAPPAATSAAAGTTTSTPAAATPAPGANSVVTAAPASGAGAGSSAAATGADRGDGAPAAWGSKEAKNPIADLGVTYALAGRSLSLGGGTPTSVATYQALWISQLGLEGAVFFDRFAPRDWMGGLGLGFDYRRSLGLSSAAQGATNQSFSTVWQEFDMAVRYRHELGKVWLTGGLGFGMASMTFSFPAASALRRQSPNTGYEYLRLDAHCRWPVAMLFLQFGAALRYALGTGDIGTVLGNDKVWGFDGDLGVFYPLLTHLEVGGSLFYTRFNNSFSSAAPGAATSAADQYYGLRAAAILRF